MEQGIYVDVLLVTNYIINMLIIICTGKLTGRSVKRRRIVAAALFGAITALTIFLPFMGFFISILIKLVTSSAIVLIAFSFITVKVFFKQLFLFFAVSFAFAGVMLGVWLMFTPSGMTYYNGVVYFDISSILLIVTTIVAYAFISIASRFAKGNKFSHTIYKVTIFRDNLSVKINGLVDTGNHLREPFSNAPVIVCQASLLYTILPIDLVSAVESGKIFNSNIYGHGLNVRMIPYSNVGGTGVLAAFKADYIIIETSTEKLKIEQVYIGLSSEKIGDERYSCILNPDLIGFKTNTIMVVPH